MNQIQSLQHPLIKHLVKLRQMRDYRYDHGTCVVEGIKLIHELCQIVSPKAVLAVRKEILPPQCTAESSFLVSEQIMNKASGLLHPEGLLAEFPMPPFKSLSGIKRILALDGINDPGNLGALLRSALAFGWKGIFLFNETCDPYNEKAIRAAKGAAFHLQLFQGSQEEFERFLAESRLQAAAADLKGVPFAEAQFPEGIVLVMGNEARGISRSIRKLCRAITIPMSEDMESLNVAVAGGILMQHYKAIADKKVGNEK